MKIIRSLIAVTFILFSCSLMAQPPGGGPQPKLSPEKREKVEAMKVAFITRKLNITSEEAKVFWPVYNQLQDELFALRDKRGDDLRDMKDDKEGLTEKDYEKLFDGEISFRQAELDIMKKYQPQLKKTLPIQKLAKLHRVEEEFKRELLQMLGGKNDRKQGPGPGNGHRPPDRRN